METFGLFQLLHSMLNTPPKEPQQKTDAPTPVESTPPPPPKEEQTKPNACVEFFEAHERRAKRK